MNRAARMKAQRSRSFLRIIRRLGRRGTVPRASHRRVLRRRPARAWVHSAKLPARSTRCHVHAKMQPIFARRCLTTWGSKPRSNGHAREAQSHPAPARCTGCAVRHVYIAQRLDRPEVKMLNAVVYSTRAVRQGKTIFRLGDSCASPADSISATRRLSTGGESSTTYTDSFERD